MCRHGSDQAGVIGDVHHVTIDMGINLPEFPKNDGGILSIMGVMLDQYSNGIFG